MMMKNSVNKLDTLPHKTTADGNCAFHAIFGHLVGDEFFDAKHQFHRAKLVAFIKDNPLSNLIVKEHLKHLLHYFTTDASERHNLNNYPKLHKLSLIYYNSVNSQARRAEKALSTLEEKFRERIINTVESRNKFGIVKTLELVTAFNTIKQKRLERYNLQRVSSKKIFRDILIYIFNDREAIHCSHSKKIKQVLESDLKEFYDSYIQTTVECFDFSVYLTPSILRECAKKLSTKGTWLPQCAIPLIAHAFDISIDYYLGLESQGIYNPGKIKKVYMSFNGRDHFEKIPKPEEINIDHSVMPTEKSNVFLFGKSCLFINSTDMIIDENYFGKTCDSEEEAGYVKISHSDIRPRKRNKM